MYSMNRRKTPKKSLVKKFSGRAFLIVWCMWERQVSIEHVLVRVESSGGIDQ